MACVEFIALLYKQLVLMDIEVLYLLRTRALWLIPSLNPDTYDNNLKVTTPNSPQVFGLNRKNQRYTCNPKEKKMLLHSTSLIHRRYDENGWMRKEVAVAVVTKITAYFFPFYVSVGARCIIRA